MKRTVISTANLGFFCKTMFHKKKTSNIPFFCVGIPKEMSNKAKHILLSSQNFFSMIYNILERPLKVIKLTRFSKLYFFSNKNTTKSKNISE